MAHIGFHLKQKRGKNMQNSAVLQAVQNLYITNESFRIKIDEALKQEADAAQKLANNLQSVLASGPEEVTQTPVKSSTKRGRPVGSKNTKQNGSKKKTAKKTTKSTVASEDSPRLTHKEAIRQVLGKASAAGLTSGEIFAAVNELQSNSYTPPSSATLLTTLHGMKKDEQIKASGDTRNLHYSIK
jgi:hypothetical protein